MPPSSCHRRDQRLGEQRPGDQRLGDQRLGDKRPGDGVSPGASDIVDGSDVWVTWRP